MNKERFQARQRIKEGDKALVYDDATGKVIRPGTTVVGNPTIGVGRNLIDGGLRASERQLLLDNDTAEVDAELRAQFPWYAGLDDVRQEVLMEMRFNMGLTRLLTFRKFLGAVKMGDFQSAAREMEDSAWFRQVGDRAAELKAAMDKGKF